MRKLFIKRKPFSRRFLASGAPPPTFAAALPAEAGLPLAYLDEPSFFETLRAYRGVIFESSRHLERLEGSCRSLGFSLPWKPREMGAWLDASLKESGFKEAMLRVSAHLAPKEAALVLMLLEFRSYPAALYKEGVSVETTAVKRPFFKAQDPQIKASQFVPGVLAWLEKTGEGRPLAHEFLFLHPSCGVAEGTVSNVFIFKDKRLLTPSVSSGILRGVTRSVVLELAAKRKVRALETTLTRHELYSADECFITNTSSEILPVVAIDGRRIGAGRPGPETRLLAKAYKEYVSSFIRKMVHDQGPEGAHQRFR